MTYPAISIHVSMKIWPSISSHEAKNNPNKKFVYIYIYIYIYIDIRILPPYLAT